MKKKWLFFTPLLMLLGVCILLIAGLNQDPKKIASALIDKPIPEFYQANLFEPTQTLSLKDFPKTPFLLNVWGSWCGYCKEEHPLLMDIAKTIPIIGIDYRDNPQNGREMLKRMGNPFLFTIDDSHGEFAMKLGVDGAPETYLVDAHGIIRYRHSGLLDRETWKNVFIPKIQQLMKK
ncbi:thiol:disulfide interchange protein [Rodentibacter ratti]|uniref:Thiol:disulfide interchange protein n=1 Tax=Rodentibacter ratti TaxID=1906745 RepID=A0A1V3L351_9PAST|nr:DsbE family thiol:disulfide interchange protein [Rodentibacter ratti]OOF84251.1 thiol:disulfide interchange protein [Rodentibacter ratti]